MKYLVDTQILIGYQLDSKNLNSNIHRLLNNRQNAVFVSHISLFEIAIKQKIGKLPELDVPIGFLAELTLRDGFVLLPIQTKHIEAYDLIPLLPGHRDPFDRLLLATAFSENMAIISADIHFKSYETLVNLISND